jgi:predicted dehydrogenase
LAGVWGRDHAAASDLAKQYGAKARRRYEDLLEDCDAVALAVTPAVQPELAMLAVQCRRPVLLEKPLAVDVAGARRLADAMELTGTPSQMVMTWRYAASVRSFVSRAADLEPIGGFAQWISASAVRGASATSWRHRLGPLLDLGPHLIDLLGAVLGPVETVHSHGSTAGSIGLLLGHTSGATSEVTMCTRTAVAETLCRICILGRLGARELAPVTVDADTWSRVMAEFASTVRSGVSHPLDVRHGLYLQETLDAAGRQLLDA